MPTALSATFWAEPFFPLCSAGSALFLQGNGDDSLADLACDCVGRGVQGRQRNHRQIAYEGFLGSPGTGGISNLYYPAASRNGVALTLEGTGLGTLGSAAGNLFQEFVAKRFTPKVPDYAATSH